MKTALPIRFDHVRRLPMPASMILVCIASITLVLAAFLTHRLTGSLPPLLFALVSIAFVAAIVHEVDFLVEARRHNRRTSSVLNETECEFQSIFDSALDAILILDDEGTCLEANPAALTLFSVKRRNLVGHSFQAFLSPTGNFERDWKHFLVRKQERCEMRIDLQNGDTLYVEYTAKANYLPGRHVAVLRDITRRREAETARQIAEEEIARNYRLAESARAEADAFRSTTLALTQNLSMDNVLDTLLDSLLKLIPCESARVLLLETPTQLFLAREVQGHESTRRLPKTPTTWDASDNFFLMKVLSSRAGLLVSNSAQESGWERFKGNSHFRSWLCVPLIASDNIVGLLSLGDARIGAFSQEHLRLANSLAIPAAVAIQNARLYQRAEIYGAELEQRLAQLQRSEHALRRAERGWELSEDKFTKVIQSSSIAFSITTVAEGLFIEVNEAFERRYGYLREELIGRTVFDVGIWGDASERAQMLKEIQNHGCVRGRVTRLRKRSGELVDTVYNAEFVALGGRECVLAVSEDLPQSTLPGPSHLEAKPASR